VLPPGAAVPLGAGGESGPGERWSKPVGHDGRDGPLFVYSLLIATVLGTMGLPHILVRFYTVPTAKAARKSVLWAIGIIGGFYLMTLALGFGAAALVGPKAIKASNAAGNTAAPLLAEQLGGGAGSTGGAILLAVISAVAFATILAVVAGLTLASSASFAHDLWANVIRRGKASEKEEVRSAKLAAVAIGAIAILLSIFADKLNAAALVALAFAVAASANLPTLLYSLFWKRFNTSGALWSIYGGLSITVLLIVFSPVVSGKKDANGNLTASMIQGVDFHLFPLDNPGIVSIPLSFLLGYLGTVLAKEKADPARYAEMEVRSLTGVGSAKANVH
jgi:cation/acetate symporter